MKAMIDLTDRGITPNPDRNAILEHANHLEAWIEDKSRVF